MANRFPLIVNPDTKEIQEINQGDNLDLTGNGVYAGGSLGQNGQVLTTTGTSVEWRTVTGGGGGGGGIDLDTTYIIETQEQVDGANLNLVAGGTGVGTLSIKFEDTNQLQFDAPDTSTLRASIKDASITNAKLDNSNIVLTISGVNYTINLGDTFVFPNIGDVFLDNTQTLKNKTLENCTFDMDSQYGNTLANIPNASLQNSFIKINNQEVFLGNNINIAGGGGTINDTNTTYTLTAVAGSVPEQQQIRLTDSDGNINNVTLIEGTNVQMTRSGNAITLSSTDTNTDTNTTYSITSTSLQQGNTYTGAKFNLSDSDGNLDTVNLRNGTGVTVNSIGADDIQFSIGQAVDTNSDVTFNNLTVNGGLTVDGALSYINTTNLKVTDKTLTIADGVTNSTNANGAGILIGTSNINFTYNHATSAWQPTTHINLVDTKVYKIAGNDVLSSTRVLGKTMPNGDIIGTIDTQSLSNKTLNSPIISTIINTGTLTLPAPTIADTLVGRATQDILTNKSIDGDFNTLENIGNSSLSNSYMTINGTQRNLGDSFTVTATDPYSDEKAQDAAAGMITSATHSGISWTYDDTAGKLAATVNETIDLTTLKAEVAAATDFADFQNRIAAL